MVSAIVGNSHSLVYLREVKAAVINRMFAEKVADEYQIAISHVFLDLIIKIPFCVKLVLTYTSLLDAQVCNSAGITNIGLPDFQMDTPEQRAPKKVGKINCPPLNSVLTF